jgi:hypothetical protein
LEQKGIMEFEIPDVSSGSMVACRVVMADSERYEVPSWQLGRLMLLRPS